MFSSLKNPRQAAAQLLNFGLILSTAFMVSTRGRILRFSTEGTGPAAANQPLDVERNLCRHRQPEPNRCSIERLHGAGLPAGRSPSAMEPEPILGVAGWRDCRVQHQRQGHPHRAPRCAQVRDWVRRPPVVRIGGLQGSKVSWRSTCAYLFCSQARREAIDKGRQQSLWYVDMTLFPFAPSPRTRTGMAHTIGRRYRAVRTRTGLSGQERHYWVRANHLYGI